MTPEQWRRVKAVASAAWEQPEGQRTGYLRLACADDSVLYDDATALVRAMAEAENRSFPTAPRPDALASQSATVSGRCLGPYRILEQLGVGGMGEVYRARDTRLDRLVAVKVIAQWSGLDPPLQARLWREARAVAALNHPHICTVHDIGCEDGLDYLVMEYLEGETLESRLRRGPLSLREALTCADEIAAALTAAHRAGIVHRDLKPANIMLAGNAATGLPHVKLLDFGIATAIAGGRVEAAGATRGPGLTADGLVAGTIAYMAPEQFGGRATERTDVFAFGAVVYEMLSGRQAFVHADVTTTAEGGLTRAPEPHPRVSRAVGRIVERCVQQDPEQRYPSMQEVAAELHKVRRSLDAARRRRRLLMVGLGLIGLISAGTIGLMTPDSTTSNLAAPTVVRLTASTGVLGAPALSPDGSAVVYSSYGDTYPDPELVLQRIDSLEHARLTNDAASDEWPTWSPDGKEVAFIRCGAGRCGIFRLPIGGAERLVLGLHEDRYNGLAWSRDGRSLAYAARQAIGEPYALHLVDLATLSIRRLTSPRSGLGDFRFAFSPDGEHLAIVRLTEAIDIYEVSVRSGQERRLLAGLAEWVGGVAWTADGRHLVLSANRQGVRRLWRLPVAGGDLEQVAVAGENAYYPATSLDGKRLVFVYDFYDWDIWRTDLSRLPAQSSPFPASSAQLDIDPMLSPDGQRLAFTSERGGAREIWVSRADGAGAVQVTSVMGAHKPRWSPDGRWLAFHSKGIHVIPASGGTPRLLWPDGEMPTWSADSKWVYFRRRDATDRLRVWRVAADGSTPAVQAYDGEAGALLERANGERYVVGRDGIGRLSASGKSYPVIREVDWHHLGYWTIVDEGIYFVAAQRGSDGRPGFALRFFDFATRRTSQLAVLPGILDAWVGGLTVSADRRTVLYSQRAYHASEIRLIENFR